MRSWVTGGYETYGIYAQGYGASDKNYAGYFAGHVYHQTCCGQLSDRRVKTNVTALDGANALGQIQQLQPISYRFKGEAGLSAAGMEGFKGLPEGRQLGFEAQQMAQVLPELVREEVQPLPAESGNRERAEPMRFKSVNYVKLVPVLVKAMQEQQAQIEAQQKEIDALKDALRQQGITVGGE